MKREQTRPAARTADAPHAERNESPRLHTNWDAGCRLHCSHEHWTGDFFRCCLHADAELLVHRCIELLKNHSKVFTDFLALCTSFKSEHTVMTWTISKCLCCAFPAAPLLSERVVMKHVDMQSTPALCFNVAAFDFYKKRVRMDSEAVTRCKRCAVYSQYVYVCVTPLHCMRWLTETVSDCLFSTVKRWGMMMC